MRYDLHIHSCLSPCADREMTPATIAGLCALNGADVIAIADHNSARNLPAAEKCCKAYGIQLLPALEANTTEEIHLLCYFPTVEAALALGDALYESLPEFDWDPAIWGPQWVMNEDDEIIDQPKKLLTAAAGLTLEETTRLCRELAVPCYLLGNGSNILFGDRGYAGAVVSLAGMKGEVRREGDTLTAPAGMPLSVLCTAALRAGLTGLEFAYGIPGTVGGAVYMNAGAYGGEMKDVLASVRYLTAEGQIVEAPAAELDLGYRHSVFESNGGCILSAAVRLAPGNPEAIAARMDDLMGRRRDKQPLDKPSAGSTFKRPVGAFAGALIEQCGLRGYRHGGAAISEKHCGFVVNLGGATCADVLALCAEVQKIVKEQTGFTLEKEIRVVEL